MLLSYSIKNYKSINTEQKISFKPDTNIEDKNKKLLNDKTLPVLAIYGSNGGGKTSMLESFMFFHIIFMSFNKNNLLEMYQNIKKFKNIDSLNSDIEWKIEFLVNDFIYNYQLSVSEHGISFEKLTKISNLNKNEEVIFCRNEDKVELNKDIANLKIDIKQIIYPLILYINSFVVNSDISKTIDEIINLYFFRADNFEPVIKSPFTKGSWNFNIDILISHKDKLLDIFKAIDLNITDIQVIENSINNFEILFTKQKSFGEYQLSFTRESKGTQKIIKFLCDFIDITEKGGGLFCIDELDNSLHPKLLGYIIDIFHSINNKNVQLLFTTHDMFTLDKKYFRKDEIYFARLNESFYTDLICLNDFNDLDENKNFSNLYTNGDIGYEPYIEKMRKWND